MNIPRYANWHKGRIIKDKLNLYTKLGSNYYKNKVITCGTVVDILIDNKVNIESDGYFSIKLEDGTIEYICIDDITDIAFYRYLYQTSTNIYASPDINSKKIAEITLYDQLQLLPSDINGDNWVKCHIDRDIEGYIPADTRTRQVVHLVNRPKYERVSFLFICALLSLSYLYITIQVPQGILDSYRNLTDVFFAIPAIIVLAYLVGSGLKLVSFNDEIPANIIKKNPSVLDYHWKYHSN